MSQENIINYAQDEIQETIIKRVWKWTKIWAKAFGQVFSWIVRNTDWSASSTQKPKDDWDYLCESSTRGDMARDRFGS